MTRLATSVYTLRSAEGLNRMRVVKYERSHPVPCVAENPTIPWGFFRSLVYMKLLPEASPALLLLLLLLAGGLLLVLCGTLLFHPVLPPTASQRTLRPQGVTQNDFKALYGRSAQRPSISYAQVVARLGEGSPVDSSADGRTRTYQWHGGGRWARLEATFQDGHLVGKGQFLLSH